MSTDPQSTSDQLASPRELLANTPDCFCRAEGVTKIQNRAAERGSSGAESRRIDLMLARALSVFAATLALSPGAVTASVISFDSFGAGDSYDTGFRYGVDGRNDLQAFRWVAEASGRLDSITVAVGRTTAATMFTQFDLFQVSGTMPGWSLLESLIVTNDTVPGPTPGGIVSASSSAGPLLQAGQTYWLAITEPDAADGSQSLWFFNDQGLFGTRMTPALPPHGAWLPAFRISVVQAPEPGTLLLLGMALASMGLSCRRKA